MKQKVGCGIGIVIVLILVLYSPWAVEENKNSFQSILRGWGNSQTEISEKFTTEVVSGVEGGLVGEHEIDGSNWAIPNIIRHWLGVR